MKILSLEEIKARIDLPKIIAEQEEGFRAYSEGRVNVPPVGHMAFQDPPGDYHIKYGMIEGDVVFVIKIAGGFYNNPYQYNLPAIQGLMLVMCARTGQPLYLLQDEGYLTNLRTAIAGFISAKYLAPKKVTGIGVIGTGEQARLQVEILKDITPCRHVCVLGRTSERVDQYIADMQMKGFETYPAKDSQELAENCNLIITTTAATEPLLFSENINPGTHITAMGADSPGKQELDSKIFAKADICVVDSKNQCIDHGETSHAIKSGVVTEDMFVELGQLISTPDLARKNDEQTTLIDLTGVATQDVQIAKSIAFS